MGSATIVDAWPTLGLRARQLAIRFVRYPPTWAALFATLDWDELPEKLRAALERGYESAPSPSGDSRPPRRSGGD